MHRFKRWSVLFVLMIVIMTLLSYNSYRKKNDEGDVAKGLFGNGEALHLWYADAALTDYLTNAAAAYYEETGITVIPVLYNEAGYLEAIYNESLKDDESVMPDMYLLGNDSLGRAVAAGLTCNADNEQEFINRDNFQQTALDAVSWNGESQGFPLYFETTVLLYNKTYMEGACVSAAEREEAEAVGEVTSVEGEDDDGFAEALTYEDAVERGYTLDMILPNTVAGILEFANNYDAPMDVESVFKWDVTDIFYNYYFPGSYMDVGGETGDDPERLDIDNDKVRECLSLYQTLNQFFSIDTKDVSYDKVLEEFIDGKVVMTVATSDAVARMEEAIADGRFKWEYETTMIPEITDDLDSRSLSVTTALVINGFSERKKACQDFSRYLISERIDLLYDEAGKIPAFKDAYLPNDKLKPYVHEYSYSISMPKLLSASNFWVQLEICCARIWEGADVGELLSGLQAAMDSLVG